MGRECWLIEHFWLRQVAYRVFDLRFHLAEQFFQLVVLLLELKELARIHRVLSQILDQNSRVATLLPKCVAFEKALTIELELGDDSLLFWHCE